jgi:hypothetical protein
VFLEIQALERLRKQNQATNDRDVLLVGERGALKKRDTSKMPLIGTDFFF